MNYPTYELDLLVHRYPTRDGRHFSSEELADEADGKITLEEACKRTRQRIEAGGGYVHKRRNMA